MGKVVNTEAYLEPLKYYEHSLKEEHAENVSNYIDELAKESGVNIDENAETCKKVYQEENKLKHVSSLLGRAKAGFVIFLILFILSLVGAVICFFLASSNPSSVGMFIGIGIGALALAGLSFYLFFFLFRKKKKALAEEKAKLEAKVNELKQEAWNQMAPLNAKFNSLMAPRLFTKSAPLIEFDDMLSSQVEERIVNQFEDKLDDSIDRSTMVVQSGHINTNPFILRQVLKMHMEDYTYTGTLVITYTKTVSDGNGGTTTTTVTQTLVAHVVRPKPYYGIETTLTYYSDFAEKLSFSRTPAGLVGKDKKAIDKIAEKRSKADTKKAEQAVRKGEEYMKFANSKFEVYFNCDNRDDEHGYRSLFTPLAQENLCYNFSKVDDIYYTKKKCANIIYSNHDKDKDYSGDPSNYYHFDFEVIKKNFINYNTTFFDGIYMDFVPLLSIPAFHENASAPYKATTKEPLSLYEAEAMVNKFDPNLFKAPNCDTDVILKVAPTGKNIMVTAHGFHADPRVETVPVIGGDGRTHLVPVHYYEYLRVQNTQLVNASEGEAKVLDKDSGSVINYKLFNAKVN